MHVLGEKPEADCEEFFHGLDHAAIHQKQNDVIVGFNHDVAVSDYDLLSAYHGAYADPFWQLDFVQPLADHPRRLGVPVRGHLNGFGCAAPQ